MPRGKTLSYVLPVVALGAVTFWLLLSAGGSQMSAGAEPPAAFPTMR